VIRFDSIRIKKGGNENTVVAMFVRSIDDGWFMQTKKSRGVSLARGERQEIIGVLVCYGCVFNLRYVKLWEHDTLISWCRRS
jgi:hypothetical protein